jgi:sec-independent protein translocase protein TatC
VTRRPTAAARESAGTTPLAEHLRELRTRLVISLLAVGVGSVIAWFCYDPVFAFIRAPFDDVVAEAQGAGRDMTLAFTGVADPFVMQLKVAGVVGALMASPVWLYQLWRFITPGLHSNERRWALGFVLVATPLFLTGAAMAYVVLPKGLEILLGFTPEHIENIISVDRYLSFFLRMLLVFGIGFLLPLLVVALNLAGVLSFARLASWWRWIVMGVVVFAAAATPTGDPFNLFLLAAPILALMALAGGVAWANDRRRARRRSAEPQWADDETSPLTQTPTAAEDRPSPLDDEPESRLPQ